MGEAKRRKANLKEMFDQAQGVFEGRLYHMKSIWPVMQAILAGANPRTDYDRNIILHIGAWFQMLGKKQYRKPPLCLLCDYEFLWQKRLPDAFYWMLPKRDDLTQITGSLSAICHNCASKLDDELEKAIMEAWRNSYIPDIRKIEIHETPGKA
jgi:hypothetical protein